MNDDLHKGAYSQLFNYARRNRKSPTRAEAILWKHLRNRKLKGCKFRRQHPLSNYVLDFYCSDCLLVVEVDGQYHNSPEQIISDRIRTEALSKLGIEVIRFTNDQVLKNLEQVLQTIVERLGVA
jgi:very-short-patch-repair endonuclease